jgi:P27 family predicted phage terminase small subunit
MPNPRKPEELKRLAGTFRKDRNKPVQNAGERLIEQLEAPDSLSDGGKVEWDALMPVLVDMGVLTLADLRTLALLCETLATVTELENTVQSEGFTIPAATGGHKAHPALRSLETTRNAAHRMLGDFGLHPKARNYVSRAPGPATATDDPFSRLDDDFE